MLFIVRAHGTFVEMYEYEYGYLKHAMGHFNQEQTADLIWYDEGKERILARKIDGKALTTQN